MSRPPVRTVVAVERHGKRIYLRLQCNHLKLRNPRIESQVTRAYCTECSDEPANP